MRGIRGASLKIFREKLKSAQGIPPSIRCRGRDKRWFFWKKSLVWVDCACDNTCACGVFSISPGWFPADSWLNSHLERERDTPSARQRIDFRGRFPRLSYISAYVPFSDLFSRRFWDRVYIRYFWDFPPIGRFSDFSLSAPPLCADP